MKKTIMFTIEHKERELVPKIFLAYKLALKGFRVYIGTFSAIDTVAHALKPSIFFHKSGYKNQAEHYRNIGHTFVIMDEEGGITTPRINTEGFCKNRYRNINKKRADIILLPSKRFKDNLIKLSNVKDINLEVTGWPRVDLWRSEYKYLYEKSSQKIKSRYGSFYLLITSFGMTSKKTYDERMKHESEFYRKLYKHKYDAFLKYVELIKDLSKLIKDNEKLIVRPHPSESMNDWKNITKDLSNVLIIRDGDITPWILESDGIVQYGSTTATQASLNGKNCIQYRVEKQEGITDTPSFELCQDANTPEEVYSILQANKGKFDNAVYERAVQYLKEEMAFDEDELAVDKIVKILDDIEREKVPKARLNIWSKYLKPELLYFKNVVKKSYYKINKFIVAKKTTIDKIPGGINSSEILEYINALKENDENICDYDVKQICRNLVCIERREGIND